MTSSKLPQYIARCLILFSAALSMTACQEFQRADIDLQRQRIEALSTAVMTIQRTFCEDRCESMHLSCWAHVSIIEGLPGTEPPRVKGPVLPGCQPFGCDDDKEVYLAKVNPLRSCAELTTECKAEC